MNVMFLRLRIKDAEAINRTLTSYCALGWRVVSHAEGPNEYSFVLEKP